jgi:pyruvate/2-oxoglutarate dehydrogenase complex dihydrolipoamide acyltransferase (E2) component
MTQLTDTQRQILATACTRPGRIALPLPERLKGGAAAKVVAALMAKDLLAVIAAKPGEPLWRETDDGHGLTLVATDAALAALGIEPLGIEPEDAPSAPTGAAEASAKTQATHAAAAARPAPEARAGTKLAHLIAMLQSRQGASMDEIATVLGWRQHTVRAAISHQLKKQRGLDIVSMKVDGVGRVYRIVIED